MAGATETTQTELPPVRNDAHSLDDSERVGRVAFLVALSLLTVAAVLVSIPVLVPLIFAAITTGLADPLKLRIDRRLPKHRRLSAGLALFIMVVVLLVPMFFIGFFTARTLVSLLTEATRGSAPLSEVLRDGIETLSEGPLGSLFGSRGIATTDQVVGVVNESLKGFLETLTQLAAVVPNFLIMLLIYLYSLYYFLLDGRALLLDASSAIPLRREEKKGFGETFLRVSRATLRGTIVIGGLQGLIGGALFWALGLPAPLVFAVLFALLAVIPNFGAILIWLPAAIILFIAGQTGRGFVMLILGGGLLAGVDYLVRPMIIRSDAQLHPVLAISGIIGGLALFGLAGLVLGPIIMALFVAIWNTFRGRYRGELEDVASGKA